MAKNDYFCTMILEKLSLINYKNIQTATLELSPKINCLIGQNGVGKTNVLDAIYYLSFCHSLTNPVDSQVIRHGEEFFMIEGVYYEERRDERVESLEFRVESLEFRGKATGGRSDSGGNERREGALTISCGLKRGSKKHFKKNKKEYKRLSEHIGLIPIVMVSPSDTLLIEGGSEDRRKLMDIVISQYDYNYLELLNRYNKALQQRNTMLKAEEEPDLELISLWEEQMAASGEAIYQKRDAFVKEMVPIFQRFYETISGNREQVAVNYISHCQRGPLLEVIQRDRFKDRAIGYSLHGIHRDDLEFSLSGHLIKREGSQGQNKTFVISLKLAQFEILKRTNTKTTPLLLLDDIFDKLDAGRVEQIVSLVAGDEFGQIFITDTNRDHLDQILRNSMHDYRIFYVEDGEIKVKK